MALKTLEKDYLNFLQEVKSLIKQGHQKAALAVNTALIQTYWILGERIAQQQALFEGRNSYVEQLAKDLRAEFPEMKGFSRSNLFYIRKFYQFYANTSVQQLVGLNETASDKNSVQQTVELEIQTSVQQPVGFNC